MCGNLIVTELPIQPFAYKRVCTTHATTHTWKLPRQQVSFKPTASSAAAAARRLSASSPPSRPRPLLTPGRTRTAARARVLWAMACSFSLQAPVSSSPFAKSICPPQLSSASRSHTSFFGLPPPEVGVGSEALNNTACRGISSVRLPAIRARVAGASKTIEVDVDKPLGLALGQKSPGVVVITAVDSGGNAAKAGLKAGDQVIYTSSFFGDELWPADKLGLIKTAIQAKPESVYFVVSRGAEVDVKRLPKRPAPPRFGRKLTEAQKARATHICLDCGYIYTLNKPFDEQPEGFKCPQCAAPKKRFAGYDPETGRALGGNAAPLTVILGVLVGFAAIAGLVFYGSQ